MSRFFNQGIAILFAKVPILGELRQRLEQLDWTIAGCEEASNWPAVQGPRLTLSLQADSAAVCWVDIGDGPWPDDLGADSAPNPVASAQEMGAFGPHAVPGALRRAADWRRDPTIAKAAERHTAFVRLRTTSFFTVDAPMTRPSESNSKRDAAGELIFLARLANALVGLPDALVYFNPNAEILLLPTELALICESTTSLPLEAIVKTRVATIEATYSLADTLGVAQFDLPDHEIAWADKGVTSDDATAFHHHLVLDHASSRSLISSGYSTDGPKGMHLTAQQRQTSCLSPYRQVIHWRVEQASEQAMPLLGMSEDSNGAVAVGTEADDTFSTEFAALLHNLETWLSQQQSMRARAARWLRSPEFRSTYYDDIHAPPIVRQILEKEQGVKATVALWENAQKLGIQSPKLWQQYQQLIEHGEVWFAVSIMSNPEFSRRPYDSLPCLVLVPTKQTAMGIAHCGLLASLLYGLYTGEAESEAHPQLAEIMSDDDFKIFRRVALPVEECDGLGCMVINVHLRKTWMPPAEVGIIPLLAMPSSKGAVLQIPWSVAIGSPALPGSMKPGAFADLSEFADALLPATPAAKPNFVRSLVGLTVKLSFLMFVILLVVGLDTYFGEDSSPPTSNRRTSVPIPKRSSSASVITAVVPATAEPWRQTETVWAQVSTVSYNDYAPLIAQGSTGSGFIFRTAEGMVLAACSRHQFANPNQAPSKFFNLDDLEVSLNSTLVVRAPDSQVQLVTAVNGSASCLDYRSSDLLRRDDQVRLVLDRGQGLNGRLQLDSDLSLTAGPTSLRALLESNTEDVNGSSGSPIINLRTRRVIGVMLAADQADSPSFIEFETLCIRLSPSGASP